MNLFITRIRNVMLCVVVLILHACVKTIPDDPNNPPPGNNGKPTITPVGDPAGDAITATIGADGGSITSSDGKTELIFPSGALIDNTEISIQPMTNTAPNGVGYSYRFLPEGMKFLQPVTVKFHYTADDLAATLADLMGIAFQDSTGGWWRIIDFTNDTVNKIISAPIQHFSIWTAFDMLLIYPRFAIVSVGKTAGVEVQVVESDDELTELGPGATAEAPIIRSTGTKPIIWSASDGTIKGTSFYAATFTAPSTVPPGNRNPVNVDAKLDLSFKYHGETFKQPSLKSALQIVDAEEYQVEFKLLDTVVDYDPEKMIVWDSVSFKVKIKDGVATISEITNFESRAKPTQLLLAHEQWYFVPDAIGMINITAVTGTVGPNIIVPGANDRLLALTITESGTHDPKEKYISLDGAGSVDYFGGDAIPGYLQAWAFELDQTGMPVGEGSSVNGILIKVIESKITLLKH